jgi:hypothetical protein
MFDASRAGPDDRRQDYHDLRPQGRRHLRDRVQDRELPRGVAYMPKPWQPLNVLIGAEQALAFRVCLNRALTGVPPVGADDHLRCGLSSPQ